MYFLQELRKGGFPKLYFLQHLSRGHRCPWTPEVSQIVFSTTLFSRASMPMYAQGFPNCIIYKHFVAGSARHKSVVKNTVWESDAQSWESDSQMVFFASIPNWEDSQTVFFTSIPARSDSQIVFFATLLSRAWMPIVLFTTLLSQGVVVGAACRRRCGALRASGAVGVVCKRRYWAPLASCWRRLQAAVLSDAGERRCWRLQAPPAQGRVGPEVAL